MIIRLAHEIGGPADAPALVLANSLGTTTAMWEQQLPELRARFRVLRYDHRGHGDSPVPPGPYTLDELGADLIALLDRLRLARVDFCGLSLGGMVGMWLAAHAPARVRRLVLCCTSAHLPPASLWTGRAARVRADGMDAVLPEVVGRWFTAAFRAREPQALARATAMLRATPAEGYASCCEAIAAVDLRPLLPAIIAPTLVIAARDDPATPPEHGAAIRRAIPGARLALVPDAAHLAPLEQPAYLTRLILDHLL